MDGVSIFLEKTEAVEGGLVQDFTALSGSITQASYYSNFL